MASTEDRIDISAPAGSPGSGDTSDASSSDNPREVDRSRILTWIRAGAPTITAVVATLWIFRPIITDGQLPGDAGDARWTIAIHEHWYQVWRGQETVRDLHYYFPVQGTLGTSDAFFVQGQLYSIARVLGWGFIDSWVFALVSFFLLGAVGVAVLAKRLLRSAWSQVAFVGLSCASYAVITGIGHIQLLGFLSVSWILVGFHDLTTSSHSKRGLTLIIGVPPLLALSSWYAVVLFAIVLAFLTFYILLFSSGKVIAARTRQIAADTWRALWSPVGAVLVVCLVGGWAAVLWVYIPSRNLLPPPSWTDVVTFSPQLSDIVNASQGGGGIWSSLYTRWFDPASYNSEQVFGFTPILLCSFGLFGFQQIRLAVLSRPQPSRRTSLPGRSGLLAVWFTVISTVVFFLVDERGESLYRFFWFHIPGLESIRAPFRVQIFLYAFAAFLVLRSLELIWERSDPLLSVPWRRYLFVAGAGVLITMIFVEMQRPLYATWTRSDLLPPALLARVAEIRDSCDAMILLDEDQTDFGWVNPINAVILSVVSEVPTPQGYSRADPVGQPVLNSDGTSLQTWLQEEGFHGRLCTVSSQAVTVLSES
jgi:hypothetical protein